MAVPIGAVAPSVGADESSERRGWKTVIASAFGLAVGANCLTILCFGVFIAPLEAEFKWSLPAVAFGASIISVTNIVLSPIQGILVDRFGGRRLLLTTIPLFAMALGLLYYLPNSLLVFYIAWILIPICGIGVLPISYLRSTAGWFDRKLGLALGFANTGIGIGAMLVPLIVATLIGWYGWREAYLGLGVLAILAWPVVYVLLSDPVQSPGGIASEGDTLREAVAKQSFWIIAVAFLLLGLFTGSIVVHQVRLMIDAGISSGTATRITAVFGGALILSRLVCGWLLDRYSASSIMVVLLTGGVVATLLFANGPSIPVAVVCSFLAGSIAGVEFDVLSYIIPKYYGRRSFGKIYGVVFSAFQIGSAVGVAATAAARGAFGNYTLAMYALSIVSVLAAILFIQLRPSDLRSVRMADIADQQVKSQSA